MSLEHAPGAGQVLVREDQEALAGSKKHDKINSVLRTTLSYAEVLDWDGFIVTCPSCPQCSRQLTSLVRSLSRGDTREGKAPGPPETESAEI